MRFSRGSEITNLSLAINTERLPSRKEGVDLLAIRITIRKGDRNAVTLHDIQARLITDGQMNCTIKDFGGCSRVGHKLIDGRYHVNWEKQDQSAPLINLPAGDEIRLAALSEVASDKPYRVELILLGEHIGQESCPGQGQATDIYLQLPNPSS